MNSSHNFDFGAPPVYLLPGPTPKGTPNVVGTKPSTLLTFSAPTSEHGYLEALHHQLNSLIDDAVKFGVFIPSSAQDDVVKGACEKMGFKFSAKYVGNSSEALLLRQIVVHQAYLPTCRPKAKI